MRTSKILNKSAVKAAAYCLAGAAAGAAVMPAAILGERGAFLPALAACMPPLYAGFAVLGAAGVFAALGAGPESATMLAASAVCILIRLWLGGAGRKRYPFAAAASVGICSLSIRLLWAALTGELFASYAPAALACVMSGWCAYCFAAAFSKPMALSTSGGIKPANSFSAGRLAMFAVCALCTLRFAGTSAGEAATAALACGAVYVLPRERAAAVCGYICIGACMGGASVCPAAVPVLAALFCPEQARKSRAAVGICHTALLAAGLAALPSFGIAARILSGAMGAAVFVLIPQKYLDRIRTAQASPNEPCSAADGRGVFLSGALNRLMSGLDEACQPEGSSVGELVYAEVCMSCENHSECYSDDSDLGIESPSHVCIRFDEMRCRAGEAERRLKALACGQSELKSRMGMLRSILPVMSMIALRGAEDGSSACKLVDIADLTGQPCAGKGQVYISPDGYACAYYEGGARISEKRLIDSLGLRFGRRMHISARSEEGGLARLEILPETAISVQTACFSGPRGDIEPSGDFHSVFCARKYLYAVISDGMGTGREAALCSDTLVCSLKDLIIAGFSPEAAIPLAAEYAKSRICEESFATLDILRLDLLSGEARFYKCGGCKSVIIGDGGARIIPGGGYPAGIMEGVDVSSSELCACAGDAIVMLTDGALVAAEACEQGKSGSGLGGLTDIADAASDGDAESLCTRIAELAQSLQTPENADDITVLVIKLSEPE